MKLFHVHVYFVSSDLVKAREIYLEAQQNKNVKFLTMYESPIGPHPMPTIEMHFDEPHFKEINNWIEGARNNFSVLIHEETGNDLYDHTHNIRWIGKAIKLDFDFFELIKKRPELRVHKD